MTIEKLSKRFESFLRVEKNLSPRTRSAYLYDLARFREFLLGQRRSDAEIRVDSVSINEVRAYIHHMKDELGYKPATLSRSISSVRVFFDFCIEERLIEVNPASGVHNPKMPKKLPVYLVREELNKLFSAPDRSTPSGARDFAILVCFAFCGVRLQELVGLNVNAVDFESRTIRVLGKGSKERLIPMNKTVEEALFSWLQVRNSAEGERAVFLNRSGHRISARMIQKIVDKYVVASGMAKEGVSPHKLRHTFATLLHGKDVDLVEIQTLLGHASISTTQIYTHTDKRRLQSAVEKLSKLGGGE